MKRILWITMLWVLALFGCTPLSEEQNLEQQVASTLTATSMEAGPTIPLPVTATDTPATTATQTATPQPSPTVRATELPTTTPIPDTPASTIVEQRCSLSEPVQVEQTDLAQGLVFDGMAEIVVLGNAGLQNPTWLYLYPEHTFSTISPYGNWIAFMTYSAVDRERDIYSMAMRVTNWNGDQEFRAQFDNLTLSRFENIRWVNDSQIIFPLAHEGELFRWLVWSPFSGEQETLSVELSGIGNHMEYFQVPPSLDPRLEFVAYPCEFCDDAEYAVKSIESDETVWLIDLGPQPSYAYRGSIILSPDGELAAVVGGRNLIVNGLWIFNRRGELVYEIVLPDIGGIVAALLLTWSPNSEYLAFSRGSYNDEGEIIETLAYVSLANGSVIDLCVDFSTAAPIWSPDSTKIAFSQQIQSGEPPRLISIVDIHSGDIIQLYDADARNLVGWIDIPNE